MTHGQVNTIAVEHLLVPNGSIHEVRLISDMLCLIRLDQSDSHIFTFCGLFYNILPVADTLFLSIVGRIKGEEYEAHLIACCIPVFDSLTHPIGVVGASHLQLISGAK